MIILASTQEIGTLLYRVVEIDDAKGQLKHALLTQ